MTLGPRRYRRNPGQGQGGGGEAEWRIAGLALLVGGGLVLYAGLSVTCGALRLEELKALRRRPAAPPS